MCVDTTYRSKEIEIMDDLDMSGDLLIDGLDNIATINHWLGGNALTISGVFDMLKDTAKDRVISIVDLGCGNGDMLRALSKVGKKRGYQLKLTGIDANQHTVDYAIELSHDFKEIEYIKQDVLSIDFDLINYDIALCTLFLHHFENSTALELVKSLVKKAKIGVIINDLHRNPIAYYLFKFITLFEKNEMTKKDGLTSILRGFKREELEAFAKKINCKSRIKWRWAFRYQWLLSKS